MVISSVALGFQLVTFMQKMPVIPINPKRDPFVKSVMFLIWT